MSKFARGGGAWAIGTVLSSASLSALQGQSRPPLITDRPDETESAATVPPGFVQLELGWSLSQTTVGDTRQRTHAVPELLARIGLTPRWEIRVGFAGWMSVGERTGSTPVREDGIGDMELGFKVRLAEAGGVRPAVALLGALSLPGGSQGFSSERADPSFRLSFSHDLSRRLALGYNLGAAWVSEQGKGMAAAAEGQRDRHGDLIYTLTLGAGLTDRLGAFAEAFGSAAMRSGRADRHAFDGGLTMLVMPNLQFDARAGVGLNAGAEDWFASAGVSVRLPG